MDAKTFHKIPEGSILLANLIGHLSPVAKTNLYLFKHRMVAAGVDLQVYQNYVEKRQQKKPLASSIGYAFETVGDLKPLANGEGFSLLLRPK